MQTSQSITLKRAFRPCRSSQLKALRLVLGWPTKVAPHELHEWTIARDPTPQQLERLRAAGVSETPRDLMEAAHLLSRASAGAPREELGDPGALPIRSASPEGATALTPETIIDPQQAQG